MRIRAPAFLFAILLIHLLGCKSQEQITISNPPPLVRPSQTRQLYDGYQQYPVPSLIPFSDTQQITFSLLGYGSTPYLIADGRTYLFPLASGLSTPTVQTQSGQPAGEQLQLTDDSFHLVSVGLDTSYPMAGINYWAISLTPNLIEDWSYPVLQLTYQGVYADTGDSYEGKLYYAIGR